MSQNELQKLLYAALASDSENAQHNARDQDSQAENAPADLSYALPPRSSPTMILGRGHRVSRDKQTAATS